MSGAELPLIMSMMGAQAVGGGVQALGGLQAGKSAEASAKYNAMLSAQEGAHEQRLAGQELDNWFSQSAQRFGAMVAEMGASGGGQSVDAAATAGRLTSAAGQRIVDSGTRRSKRLMDEAELVSRSGAEARKAGKRAAFGTLFDTAFNMASTGYTHRDKLSKLFD